MPETKNDDFPTITKEKFMEYLTKRKDLDSSFGPVIIEKYNQKEEAYVRQKAHQRETYALRMEEPEYREKTREKGKRAYAKQKERIAEGKNRFVPTPPPPIEQSRPPSPDSPLPDVEKVVFRPNKLNGFC